MKKIIICLIVLALGTGTSCEELTRYPRMPKCTVSESSFNRCVFAADDLSFDQGRMDDCYLDCGRICIQDTSVINGQFIADHSSEICNSRLTGTLMLFLGKSMQFQDSVVEHIESQAHPSIENEPIIGLKNTEVKGSIIFKNRAGIVLLDSASKILGEVINGIVKLEIE